MKKYVQFVCLVMAIMMVTTFTTVALATDSTPLPEGIDWVETDIPELMDYAEWMLGYRPFFVYSSSENGNGTLEVFRPNGSVKLTTFYASDVQTHFASQEELNRFVFGDLEANRKQYNLLVLQYMKSVDDLQYFFVTDGVEIFGKENDWFIRFYEGEHATVVRELNTFEFLDDGTAVVDQAEINECIYRANLG